jgi:hypothetical protein
MNRRDERGLNARDAASFRHTHKRRRLFEVGVVFATPAVLEYLSSNERLPQELIGYHAGGAWGVLDKADAASNDRAVRTGARILSVQVVEGRKIFVLTEAAGEDGQRRCTTLLFPEEY